MENYSYSTAYSDSVHSSPRARDIIDCDTASWDDQQLPFPNYKIKLMCSYGGKIQPRSHDNQLTYVGGDTKILAVDRNIKFSLFLSKLSSICDSPDLCFKYQLPGEDLDALISVTNDEDLEHMMLEYDRLYRASAKPTRLRLFLFPLKPPSPSTFSSSDSKSERQWFVDALNSVQISSHDDSSYPAVGAPPPTANAPDYLFGFDKGAGKVQDSKQAPPAAAEMFTKEIGGGSECVSEDRNYVGEPVVSPAEIQRQIHDLHRMQISGQDQVNPRVHYGDYFGQNIPENIQQTAAPVNLPGGYWQERHMSTGGYPPTGGTEQQVFLIPSSAGMYQTPMIRPGQVGQGYYGMQRMVPEVYREQPMYNAGPQQSFQQPNNIGSYTIGPVAGEGYSQVGYDGAGRQVYYTAAGGMASPPYQTVGAAVDGRQGGGTFNQEGKVVAKGPQISM